MTTLYRWWRDPWAGVDHGAQAASSFNFALPQIGITEGQTMVRIRGDHMTWHNPLPGGPTTGPTVMGTPHAWLIVWDDGTDPNIDTGNVDYMLTAHTHDILHMGAWHWEQVWGWGPVGSLQNQAAFWSGPRDHSFDIKVSRAWKPGGSNVQFPRYVSEARLTAAGFPILPYHIKLSMMLLAATPDGLP